MMQEYDEEALTAFEEAREVYTRLDEPEPVATCLHQIGMVYGNAGHPEAAEDAYRKSLAIRVRLGNVAGQASTLMQLGILYGEVLARLEEAVTFYRQAADKFVEIQDVTGEGRTRNNLAAALPLRGKLIWAIWTAGDAPMSQIVKSHRAGVFPYRCDFTKTNPPQYGPRGPGAGVDNS